MRRLMINEQVSWWRRRQPVVGALPERASTADEPGEAASRVTMAVALAALPARQRAVVVLRYYHDYSVEEVAELLGCSPGRQEPVNLYGGQHGGSRLDGPA